MGGNFTALRNECLENKQRMKVDTLVQARISVNLNDELNSKD